MTGWQEEVAQDRRKEEERRKRRGREKKDKRKRIGVAPQLKSRGPHLACG